MNAIKKYHERVSKYGSKYVWSVIWKNKILIPINNVTLMIGRKVFKYCKIKNTIIIESHNDFDCNGGVIYDYLISHQYNKKYRIIWLIKNKKPENLPKNVKCYNIWIPSLFKTYYLATAKYMFCDDVITNKFKRDQISIYCSHAGITLKDVKGIIVVPDDVDYILSSSRNYDKMMCNNYSIRYPNEKMLHYGFPFNDVFFYDIPNELKKITSKNYRHMILWMPTFRKAKSDFERNDSSKEMPLGIPVFENIGELNQLNKFLEKLNCLLIIKIHPMQDILSFNKLTNSTNIIVLDSVKIKKLHVDNYRLMKSANALISDYSSVAYSFLLLNRPIGFVLEDLKDYTKGLIISEEQFEKFLPGEKIFNKEEFYNFCFNVCSDEDKYRNCREQLLEWLYEDTSRCTASILDYLKIL